MTPVELDRLRAEGFEVISGTTATRLDTLHEVILFMLEDHFSVLVVIQPTGYKANIYLARSGLEWLLAMIDQMVWSYLVTVDLEEVS